MWYGIAFGCGSDFCGIHSYSSPDLTTWSYNGYLFSPSDPSIVAVCAMSGTCGRPHIIYDTTTKTYVLWVNAGSPGYVIFTSSSPTSGYVLSAERALIGYQPPGTQGGDFSVAVINGTGYLTYSLIDFTTVGASIWPPFLQSIYLQPLTPSLTNTAGSPTHVISAAGDLVDYEAESPDIFKRGDYFYVSASNTCGFCTGTLLVIYRSKSIQGPWQRQIISADTCGGQSTGVLTLPNPNGGATNYLHQADIVKTAPLAGTRTAAHSHQFQVLNFNSDGSIQDLDCSLQKSVTIQITPGSVSNSSGLAVAATDSSGQQNVVYTPECLLPRYQLYQTWTSSKSGNLAEVGINVAGDSPNGNLSITIFRYQNDTNFYTPRYVWDTLTSINVTPKDISEAFEVIRVPLSAAVKHGDKLGIAIVSDSATPMCLLVTGANGNGQCGIDPTTDEVANGDRTIFAIGANQVSYRGPQGKTPPVVVLPGELKWYSVVE